MYVISELLLYSVVPGETDPKNKTKNLKTDQLSVKLYMAIVWQFSWGKRLTNCSIKCCCWDNWISKWENLKLHPTLYYT